VVVAVVHHDQEEWPKGLYLLQYRLPLLISLDINAHHNSHPWKHPLRRAVNEAFIEFQEENYHRYCNMVVTAMEVDMKLGMNR
jgi:hypothetical protein